MDTIRISFPLTTPQAKTLIDLAEREFRHPREQARYLLLKALGLLSEDSAQTELNEIGSNPKEITL